MHLMCDENSEEEENLLKHQFPPHPMQDVEMLLVLKKMASLYISIEYTVFDLECGRSHFMIFALKCKLKISCLGTLEVV